MEEVWKDIEGYEDLYQISNLGRVRTRWHFRKKVDNWSDGKYGSHKRDYSVSNGSRYMYITLTKNGKHKQYYIHVLVANAFIKKPNYKCEVNHKNGYRDDNRSINLEWVTHCENSQHACNTGLRTKLNKCYAFEKNGTLIKEYTHAAKVVEDNYSSDCVYRCINIYKCGLHKNIIWSRNLDITIEDINKAIYRAEKHHRQNTGNAVIQLSIDGNIIKHWVDANIAAKTLSIRAAGIRCNCSGHRKTYKNFIWRYDE